MTRSEYQELAEFVGTKFDGMSQIMEAVDRRFDAMDRRFDAMDQRFDAIEGRLDAMETRLTRVEVTQEQQLDLIKAVAEGVANVSERLDRFQEEVAAEFRAVRAEMAAGFTSVWGEFRTVRAEMSRGFEQQSRLIEGLDVRVANLESRFGGWDPRRN